MKRLIIKFVKNKKENKIGAYCILACLRQSEEKKVELEQIT